MPEVTAIVGNKIFWEDVDNDAVQMPYITIKYIIGGFEDKTHRNAVTSVWAVSGFSANKATADAFQKALGKLHYRDLNTDSYGDAVKAYGGIRALVGRYRKDDAQNIPIYEVGKNVTVMFTIDEYEV